MTTEQPTVLIAEDDDKFLSSFTGMLSHAVEKGRLKVSTAGSLSDALRCLRQDQEIGAVIANFGLAVETEFVLLERAALYHPHATRIVTFVGGELDWLEPDDFDKFGPSADHTRLVDYVVDRTSFWYGYGPNIDGALRHYGWRKDQGEQGGVGHEPPPNVLDEVAAVVVHSDP